MTIVGRAVLVASLVLVSCGTADAERPTVQSDAPERPSVTAAAVPAARVAPLTVRTTDGKDVAIPTAGRPTIVYFMAAWCTTCLRGAVDLGRLYHDYSSRGLQVIAIDVDGSERLADLERFRSAAGDPPYFWALDSGARATRAYRVAYLDTTVLVGGSGGVLFRSDSLPDPNTLRRAVQRALGQ